MCGNNFKPTNMHKVARPLLDLAITINLISDTPTHSTLTPTHLSGKIFKFGVQVTFGLCQLRSKNEDLTTFHS